MEKNVTFKIQFMILLIFQLTVSAGDVVPTVLAGSYGAVLLLSVFYTPPPLIHTHTHTLAQYF